LTEPYPTIFSSGRTWPDYKTNIDGTKPKTAIPIFTRGEKMSRISKRNFGLLLAAIAAPWVTACGGDDDDTTNADGGLDAAADTDTDTDADADAGTDSDAGTGDTDTWDDTCNGTCGGGTVEWGYNECTCDPSDPCGWGGDGYCDISCLEIVSAMFNDDADCVANCEPVAWDNVWTYGETYAPGPYGFKGSNCYPAGGGPCFGSVAGEWTEGADHIPDACFPSAAGTEVCMRDLYGSTEYDLIIVDYTAMWCSPCNLEAESEEAFVTALAADGWNVLFITILGENNAGAAPTADDATTWVNNHDLDAANVLYDPDHVWYTDAFADAWSAEARGWPTNFFIHPSNMLIWDAFSGWLDSSDTANWDLWLECLSPLLDEMATKPGAVTE